MTSSSTPDPDRPPAAAPPLLVPREADGRLRFTGRVLFLSCSADAITAQLNGQDLSAAQAGPLRDDVSTDEITPVTVMTCYDERLGRYPYVGLQVQGTRPIGTDAVRRGGFGVTVAGARYGKGSSRESSPLAEKSAGIRLVIARSFERIYRQNCDNLGLFTSTDETLVERIRAGEPIDIEELLADRDSLTQSILRAGGLLRYSRLAMRQPSRQPLPGPVPRPAGSPDPDVDVPAPLTLAEKIIERHRVLPERLPGVGEACLLRADWRFSHDYFTGMSAHLLRSEFGDEVPLHDPDHIVAFEDHLVLAAQSPAHVSGNLLAGVRDLIGAHRRFVARHAVVSHGPGADAPLPGDPPAAGRQSDAGADGICHALMTERHALPGQVVVGTDSHTPHAGALGCLAFGAGSTDIANSWISGLIRCRRPAVIRVGLNGILPPGIMAKDAVLALLADPFIRNGHAIGAVFEFCGDAVRAMSIDERATLTNMTAELGGFTGIVAPDQQTLRFLAERRGVTFTLEDWMCSDPQARYAHRLDIDCSRLPPMVARPGDPGNGVALDEVSGPVAVDIAYGGSCTGGKREDFDAYHDVLLWAERSGLRLARGTRMVLQFGTDAVRDYCRSRGYLDTFERMGVQIVPPGCGACANCGPGASVSADEVTVSAINRNFPGRSGPGQVWLASPYTVAASAVSGRLDSYAALRARHAGSGVAP